MEITVGQVAGIIAAIVFIVQILFPNVIVLVLVCLIGNQHSAVTWSVVGRQVNNSQWPLLLQSDTNAGRGVYPKVVLMGWLRLLGAALVAVAAVATPLGLYDAIVPDKAMQAVPFTYLQDNSPLGYGTPQQGRDVWFSRSCGGFLGLAACPGSSNVFQNVTDEFGTVIDEELVGDTYDITIPQATRDLYSGGRQKFGKTVSSFFDIRTRQYTYRSEPDKNNGKPWPVNAFRMLESRVLEERMFAVQGLVVDMIKGGVGFRNHTVPRGISRGADWTEDLLWLEPLTECVDTNLTLQYTLPGNDYFTKFNLENVSIIDNGGFANLIQEYPRLSMDDNQGNPKLRERAYKAAWLVNVYSALTMNVTRPSPNAFGYLNSELGKKFPLVSDSSQGGPGVLVMDNDFSSLVSQENVLSTYNSSFTNTSTTSGIYENPFGIDTYNYSTIQLLCQGAGQADYANSSNIQVQCGLFYSAAVRADGVQSLLVEPNTTYHQNVFTCASLSKVSIKTVGFRYNATVGHDLTSLDILNITDKEYASEADMPLWGIEEPQEPLRIADVNQFWGLVSDDFNPADAAKNNISLKRAPELYLPGYTWQNPLAALYPGYEYVPAAASPKNILASTYELGGSESAGGANMDYTGSSNLALSQRWQRLSQNTSTVPDILKLIWTDLAMNAIEGTRGWVEEDELTKRDGESSASADTLVPVLIYRKKVQYRWLYAIPAFVALGLFSLLAFLSVVFSVIKQGPTRVRYYLNQLSAGRLLAMQHYPGQCEKGAPTRTWIERVGTLVVDITKNPLGAGSEAGLTPGLEQKPLMYGLGVDGKGEQVNTSSSEVMGHGNAYLLTPLSGRGQQGYVKMEGDKA